MDSQSQKTLRRVEENDAKLTDLWICDAHDQDGLFNSTDGDDFSRLGAAIEENTHLTDLWVVLSHAIALDVTNNEFYDGLKQNSSIHYLSLICWDNIAGGVGQKILEAYQENNSNITDINISRMGFENGGEHILAETLRMCTNLQEVCLYNSNINDVQLSLFIEAIRGYRSLEQLSLFGNRIGRAGCALSSARAFSVAIGSGCDNELSTWCAGAVRRSVRDGKDLGSGMAGDKAGVALVSSRSGFGNEQIYR